MYKSLKLLLTLTLMLISLHNSFAYDRDEYGGWKTNRYTKCKTNHEILITSYKEFKRKIGKCKIEGIWIDYYTGKQINEWKYLSIDHVLSVSEFDSKCRKDKSLEEIRKFYNDRENLVVTTKKENSRKGNKSKDQYSIIIKDSKIREDYINKYDKIFKKYCIY